MHDVVVIGGGPAGSMTAHQLAKQGHDVVLLEEHPSIGEPVHCTGLLGLDAFREFDLPRDIILGEAEAARFRGAAGASVTAASDRARAAVIDRARLDRALAERAARAGVDVRLGSRAETVTVEPAGVRIGVRDRDAGAPIAARACVLACGANYRFHRQLGLGLPNVFLQSAQVETPFSEMPEIEVRFGREVAPGGFAWLVPFRRNGAPHARIGLMSETRTRERFTTLVAALSERTGVDPATIPAPRQRVLPLAPVARTYASRVVAVGDAAGLVKPTTGGGIHYGLLSGSIAAQVLHDALVRDRLDAAALARYERLWRRQLGREIRVGLAFRRIAARLSDESIDALIELARVDGVLPLLQQKASFNWHRKAAIALLAHPAVRRIVFRSWAQGGGLL